VQGNELPIDDGADGEQVERVHKHIVNFLIIFIQAFSFKVEETGHLSALVVAPQEEHFILETDLYGVEKDQDFY